MEKQSCTLKDVPPYYLYVYLNKLFKVKQLSTIYLTIL